MMVQYEHKRLIAWAVGNQKRVGFNKWNGEEFLQRYNHFQIRLGGAYDFFHLN